MSPKNVHRALSPAMRNVGAVGMLGIAVFVVAFVYTSSGRLTGAVGDVCYEDSDCYNVDPLKKPHCVTPINGASGRCELLDRFKFCRDDWMCSTLGTYENPYKDFDERCIVKGCDLETNTCNKPIYKNGEIASNEVKALEKANLPSCYRMECKDGQPEKVWACLPGQQCSAEGKCEYPNKCETDYDCAGTLPEGPNTSVIRGVLNDPNHPDDKRISLPDGTTSTKKEILNWLQNRSQACNATQKCVKDAVNGNYCAPDREQKKEGDSCDDGNPANYADRCVRVESASKLVCQGVECTYGAVGDDQCERKALQILDAADAAKGLIGSTYAWQSQCNDAKCVHSKCVYQASLVSFCDDQNEETEKDRCITHPDNGLGVCVGSPCEDGSTMSQGKCVCENDATLLPPNCAANSQLVTTEEGAKYLCSKGGCSPADQILQRR